MISRSDVFVFVCVCVADVSPCAGQQAHQTKRYVDACREDYLLCFIAADSVCHKEGAQNNKLCQLCSFFTCWEIEQSGFPSSPLCHHVVCVQSSCLPPYFPSRSYIKRFFFFSGHIYTGLAPTRAEELLTFQLWPLDMLTVDDLCWCRCYVKSAPLRPHSAGAHLDCTQAGKTLAEALCSLPSFAVISQIFG